MMSVLIWTFNYYGRIPCARLEEQGVSKMVVLPLIQAWAHQMTHIWTSRPIKHYNFDVPANINEFNFIIDQSDDERVDMDVQLLRQNSMRSPGRTGSFKNGSVAFDSSVGTPDDSYMDQQADQTLQFRRARKY
jgi:hypothetical protein